MNNLKFNFAAVISLIVLLLYSYVVFMGIIYWQDGDFLKGILFTLLLIALVVVCVAIMCKARATRWKGVGKVGQLIFGGIILIVLGISSMPFAHFLKLVSNQKQISQAFEQNYEYATRVNKAYEQYVTQREQKTRDFLSTVDAGHGTSNPAEYAEIFGLPGTDNNQQKIDRMINSLNTALLPQSLVEANRQGLQHLQEGSKMSVWNVAMPANINRLDSTVKKSVETFAQLSKNAHGYKGDKNYPQFTYDNYVSQNTELKNMLTTMSMPSVLSIIAALACFAFMLLPYYLVEKDLAGLESRKKGAAPKATPAIPGATTPGGRQRRSRLQERQQRRNMQ